MTTKYIDHKKYDTDAAEELAEWDNGYRRGDSRWVDEKLKRMPDGRLFLECEGGFRTQYAKRAGLNGWYQIGEAIVALTDDEARDWAEEHLDGDEVDRILPLLDVTDEQTGTLTLDADSLTKLDAIAKMEKITREQTVARLIRKSYDTLSMR